MAVFENSRHKGSYIFDDGREDSEKLYLSPFRENVVEQELGDFKITFEEGMRIDILAREYYGSEKLEWIIMDANPKYNSPFSIKVGDVITIPNPERIELDG